MPLQNTGPIAMSDIAEEFSFIGPTAMSQWYGLTEGLPTSGEMKFSFMLGKSATISRTILTTSLNVIASQFFTPEEWSSVTLKELIIAPGVTVGSTVPGTAALRSGTGRSGLLRIVNRGSILGAGGSSNGGNGGNAIAIEQSGVSVVNSGQIRGGGGGGGRGGQGGQGGQGTATGTIREPSSGEYYSAGGYAWDPYLSNNWVRYRLYWNGAVLLSEIQSGNTSDNDLVPTATSYTISGVTYYVGTKRTRKDIGVNENIGVYAVWRTYTSTAPTTGGAGGAGGAGGQGQGYGGNQGLGDAGQSGLLGGTNAGVGGAGGNGGAGGIWATPGDAGLTGSAGTSGNLGAGTAGLAGTGGGLAGAAISGLPTLMITNTGLITGSTV